MPKKQTEEDNIYLIHQTNDTCKTEDCGDTRPEMSDMETHLKSYTENWKIDIVSIT